MQLLTLCAMGFIERAYSAMLALMPTVKESGILRCHDEDQSGRCFHGAQDSDDLQSGSKGPPPQPPPCPLEGPLCHNATDSFTTDAKHGHDTGPTPATWAATLHHVVIFAWADSFDVQTNMVPR